MIVKQVSILFEKVWYFFSAVGYRLTLFFLLTNRLKDTIRRYHETIKQLRRFVYGGLPLVIVTSFFSGLILAFQTGVELERFNQENLIGFLVPVAMCKEMGPVFTAIALVGLIGSSVAAEIAAMKVGEEIDALEVMAIDPLSYLILPRFIAFLISLPLLTAISDIVGIATGTIISDVRFDVTYRTYLNKAEEILTLRHIYGGLFKALVFGAIIAVVAACNGLTARYGAKGVGDATLRTVVTAFLFVLLFDHLLNFIIFY